MSKRGGKKEKTQKTRKLKTPPPPPPHTPPKGPVQKKMTAFDWPVTVICR